MATSNTIKSFNIISTNKKGAMIVHILNGQSVTRHAQKDGNGYVWREFRDEHRNGEVVKTLVTEEYFKS